MNIFCQFFNGITSLYCLEIKHLQRLSWFLTAFDRFLTAPFWIDRYQQNKGFWWFMIFLKFRQKILNEPNHSTTQDASCRRCVIKLHFRQDAKRPDFNKIQKLFNSSDKKSRPIEQKIMVFLLTFKLSLSVKLLCTIYMHHLYACTPKLCTKELKKDLIRPRIEEKRRGKDK